MGLKRQGKKVARFLLHRAGGLQAFRLRNRNRFRILMYHNFPESTPALQDSLAKQCAHIKRHYEVLSLTEIGQALRDGARLPKNALAITVDDGCRDFMLNAAPVFHEYKIPSLVYLVSGFLDGGFSFWWHQAAYSISQTKRARFEVALSPGKPPTAFAVETETQRHLAVHDIQCAMKELSPEDRKSMNATLARLLEVEPPAKLPSYMAPLTWPEVRQLKDQGVDFGAHTVTHPRLSQLDPGAQLSEIAESKKRIEEETGRPVLHFSYPYGLSKDYNANSVTAAAQCGFLTATTAEFGFNDAQSDPLRLRRFGVEAVTDPRYFKEVLVGLHTRNECQGS